MVVEGEGEGGNERNRCLAILRPFKNISVGWLVVLGLAAL